MAKLDNLPSEIILQIARLLEAPDIVTLQHTNRRFLSLGRDDALWREKCFQNSAFLSNLRRRRELLSSDDEQDPRFRDLARALATGNGLGESRLSQPREEARGLKEQSNERIRILANWDPSYPQEKISWYDEYIARNAPISTSWLQQPRNRDSNEHEYLEVRGMGTYTPQGGNDATMVVAPLDDGSVCLWSLNGEPGRKGRIISRSKSGLISVDPVPHTDGRRSKMISTGVTECVSVDSAGKRAYFAVQSDCTGVSFLSPTSQGKNNTKWCYYTDYNDSLPVPFAPKFWYSHFEFIVPLAPLLVLVANDGHQGLVEVDLETLSVINHERFPFSITALSEAKHPVPLTVGTNLSLYLHDPRARRLSGPSGDGSERIESYDTEFGSLGSQRSKNLNFSSLLNPEPNPIYAHLHHPGPLSILHLPSSGSEWDGNGDIYVAGRFPSILNYDRRYFPKLRGTIHSGARLCSMASLPYPFASMEKDLARRGELSTEQVWEFKNRPGKTLMAVGEYNSKGSLEMYGLSPSPSHSTISTDTSYIQNSVMKNRQTSSSSKLLSVSNHGTRIVVSDGGGNLKWLERDGFTEARRWSIAHGSVEAPRGIFGTLGDSYMDSGSGDIVIKLANTRNGPDKNVDEDDLVLWTGEKLGLLSFASKPGFTADSFEDTGKKTPEELRREMAEKTYSETMGRALEANANEVRWMRGLGLGPS